MATPHRPTRPHSPNPRTADVGSTPPTINDDLLLYTPAEAAQRLRVRESWLRKKAAARAVPCTFLGKHLRFSAHDLAAIAAGGARPATGHRPRRRTVPSSSDDLITSRQQSVHAHRDDPEPDGSSPWHG